MREVRVLASCKLIRCVPFAQGIVPMVEGSDNALFGSNEWGVVILGQIHENKEQFRELIRFL
jgi:hypothetical protein